MIYTISVSQAFSCDSQTVAGFSKLLKMGCRRALVKNFCTKQSDRIYYETFPRCSWSHSTETHLTPLKSVRIYLFTSATSHLKFARELSVMSSGQEGTPAWSKAKFTKQAIPLKTYRPAEAQIYHNCVELVIFHWDGQWAYEMQLSNTPHDQLRCRQADDAGLAQFDYTCSVSRKIWHTYFRDRDRRWKRLRYLPPR